MNYYPRYPAHYVAKTLHLTMEQDGAYTRLLDWCYANERAIPHASRYAIARATKASERAAVDAVLAEFFTQGEEGWTNGRTNEELEKAAPAIQAARANGKKGGRPRKEKPSGFREENPVGYQNETQKEPSAKAPHTPNPNHQSETREFPYTTGQSPGVGTPAGSLAAALNRAGIRITSQDPRLIAAAEAGITAAEVIELSGIYPDKPAAYLLRAAETQRAEGANGASHATRQPSRRLSAVERVEANIERNRREREGAAAADPAVIEGASVRVAN